MAARKEKVQKQADLDDMYTRELEALQADLKQQAAVSMLHRLRPTNRISVEEFFGDLRQHKDLWNVMCGMGIRDFADAVNDYQIRNLPEGRTRTRITDAQKEQIKETALQLITAHKDGLSRTGLAEEISADQAEQMGINPEEMAAKLRQPLLELLHDRQIHSQGKKRLLRYFAGAGPKAKRGE